jgi:hypothetical protein
METPPPPPSPPPEDEFRITKWQWLALQVYFFFNNLVCRALDLALLLRHPRLLRAYFGVWTAELVRSPYKWPRSFEAKRQVQATGQTVRELMYGELPIFTGVWLFWRAGLRKDSQLIDLGAGRGRALLAARWLGAKARGIELLPGHVNITAGIIGKTGAELLQGDALDAPLDDATHIFVNWTGLSDATRTRLTERFEKLRPGTRVIVTSRPVEDARFRLVSYHLLLFTWGLATAYVQELSE